ncbi:ATP-binding cassette domain-containing protein [Neolewinella aurantiaca]|uniref:ATP-binding cassette domain-containing protein n=1 Tax=Neolewinella aurantiaca TaxID=2602767 RepID=A0A5C7FUZ4_9BACT|nr:ATP-binding cassette domain-containing protein [Neolewinella aurantiaca]TXF90440.1 ATP-binding cassette domain-containing protein [Neolewinella aurantiaca]
MASSSDPTPLSRFFSLLRPDRKDIGYVYLYAVLIGILSLVSPLGVQAIINLIAGGSFNASLVILVAVVTGASVLVGTLKVMQYVIAETLQRRLFSRASFEFAYRLPRIKLEELKNDYPPELVNRFFDVITVQKGMPKILLDFSGAVMQVIFGLVLLSLYHPFFAAFGGALLLLLFLILRVMAPTGLATSLKESKYKYRVAGWLEDIARASNTFKLAGGERLTMSRTNELLEGYLDARKAHFRILLYHYGGLIGFQALVTACFLLLGGILVTENQINIGQFVAAEIVILLIISSAEKLIFTLDAVYDTLTGVEKIGTVTDLKLEGEGMLNFETVDTGSGIAVKAANLSFVYGDSGTQAIKGISFDIAANERICIAGYNRSGRSTLVQLLSGIRQDFSGSLAYNGVPIANFQLESLRRAIGDYTTEESIIPGTIIDNICLGHPDVSFADVQWALGVAQLNSWMSEQPRGYDTELITEGLNVPSSVRRRLLLARAIVRKPRLLVLGNLLDQLEPLIRREIVTQLADKRQAWTLVILSNEPEIVKACNRVMVFRRGQILLEGTPDEVLNHPPTKEIWNVTNGTS